MDRAVGGVLCLAHHFEGYYYEISDYNEHAVAKR